MKIKELKEFPNRYQDTKLQTAYAQFNTLLAFLKKEKLSPEMVLFINKGIDEINGAIHSEKELKKQLRKTQTCLLNKMEKDLKLVTKNHYRNLWMAVGMAAFGIPMGIIFGASLGNMGFIGIGLPIGMVIGIAVGTSMDKKALEEGRQLDLELK